MTISFNELRRIKAALPVGSVRRIATELGLSEQTVRNCFGGDNYDEGDAVGLHLEQGPDGGLCKIDNPEVILLALDILEESR
jgi:predicted transcriptional regulator